MNRILFIAGIGVMGLAGRATAESATLQTLNLQIAGVAKAEAALEHSSEEALWQAYTRTNDVVVTNILETLRSAPADPTEFDVLAWVVMNRRVQARNLRPCGYEALERMRDHHATQTNLGKICQSLGWHWSAEQPAPFEFLERIIANNPSRADRGYALFALARLKKAKAEGMCVWEFGPSSVRTNSRAKAAYERDSKSGTAATVMADAIKTFERVQNEFGDCPNFAAGPGLRSPEKTLGKQAIPELFECRHLEPGRTTPEISGKDLDGHNFKLSEARGKVVVLSFWASWCGPCMQMVPHEAAMAKRLAGKPFALVGVNGDDNLENATRARKKESMTWRSFQNGGDSESGIAAAWNVHGWPTVYIIDAKGIIRFKFEGYGGSYTDALLDDMADQLIAEAGKERQ